MTSLLVGVKTLISKDGLNGQISPFLFNPYGKSGINGSTGDVTYAHGAASFIASTLAWPYQFDVSKGINYIPHGLRYRTKAKILISNLGLSYDFAGPNCLVVFFNTFS